MRRYLVEGKITIVMPVKKVVIAENEDDARSRTIERIAICNLALVKDYDLTVVDKGSI